jgi:hypothetical protein
MGRHSAADDDDELPSDEVLAAVDVGAGRHHSVERPAESPAKSTVQERPKADTGTHADLRILRENPSVRARCAAAVVVPFLLYTAVLVIIARTDVYLLWIWIPTVSAGVLVGTFLDLAHRRERQSASR